MEEIVTEAAGIDWNTVASVIIALCGTGGLLYLIVEKLFGRKREKAETGTINQQNNMGAVEMYRQMDSYVEDKIEKYSKKNEERMERMEGRIDMLERLKCFNTECRNREYFPPEDGSEVLKMRKNASEMTA
jgi:hypothetical protein